jgi:hypothetical protein
MASDVCRGHLPPSIFHSRFKNAGSSNRRTAPFEDANAGAIPAPAANFDLRFGIYDLRAGTRNGTESRKSSFVNRKSKPPDGETGSCLSYKEMLRVQFLLGRPFLTRSAEFATRNYPVMTSRSRFLILRSAFCVPHLRCPVAQTAARRSLRVCLKSPASECARPRAQQREHFGRTRKFHASRPSHVAAPADGRTPSASLSQPKRVFKQALTPEVLAQSQARQPVSGTGNKTSLAVEQRGAFRRTKNYFPT